MEYFLSIECTHEPGHPEFGRRIAAFDELEIADALFGMFAAMSIKKRLPFYPAEAGDGSVCNSITLVLEQGEYQDAVVLRHHDYKKPKHGNVYYDTKELAGFIKSDDSGMMRKHIGKSTWVFTREYDRDGRVAICTIEETVDGTIMNALYDETADNCLAVFEGTYNEGY